MSDCEETTWMSSKYKRSLTVIVLYKQIRNPDIDLNRTKMLCMIRSKSLWRSLFIFTLLYILILLQVEMLHPSLYLLTKERVLLWCQAAIKTSSSSWVSLQLFTVEQHPIILAMTNTFGSLHYPKYQIVNRNMLREHKILCVIIALFKPIINYF